MRHIDEIIIHCTATRKSWMAHNSTSDKVAELKRWHVEDNNWSDIGYHFVIDIDGTVATGRPVTRPGAHCRGKNPGRRVHGSLHG
jgi:N-acetylmuramoyl-L-alanine amidase